MFDQFSAMALGILSAAARPVIAAILPSAGRCGAQQGGQEPQGHGVDTTAWTRTPRREEKTLQLRMGEMGKVWEKSRGCKMDAAKPCFVFLFFGVIYNDLRWFTALGLWRFTCKSTASGIYTSSQWQLMVLAETHHGIV